MLNVQQDMPYLKRDLHDDDDDDDDASNVDVDNKTTTNVEQQEPASRDSSSSSIQQQQHQQRHDEHHNHQHHHRHRHPIEEPYSRVVLRKFLSGYFAGMLQSAFSHPFDLVKSRIQSGVFSKDMTLVGCLRHTVRREGAAALYKGVGPPILVSGASNAVMFSSNEFWRNFIVRNSESFGLVSPMLPPKFSDPSSLQVIALSGILTAPCVATINTPFDCVKIRLQLQTHNTTTKSIGSEGMSSTTATASAAATPSLSGTKVCPKMKPEYNGMLDCFVKIYRTEGVGALYNGYAPGLLSRVVALPFYFSAADTSGKFFRWLFGVHPQSHHQHQQHRTHQQHDHQDQHGHHHHQRPDTSSVFARRVLASSLSGCCGGILFWISCYPLDILKTKTIAYRSTANASSSSSSSSRGGGGGTFVQIARDMYRRGGVASFYVGLRTALVRTIPANASAWAGLEIGERVLRSNGM